MNYIYKTCFYITLASLLSACSNSNVTHQPSQSSQYVLYHSNNIAFVEPYNAWKGTPYKYGGNSKNGVDCSAFVKAVFLESHNKEIPRTTYEQSKHGTKVHLKDARSGDLVFFKTTRKQRHVGIYLGENSFMHASTSKGVIISRLDSPYWASVFWQVRRVN